MHTKSRVATAVWRAALLMALAFFTEVQGISTPTSRTWRNLYRLDGAGNGTPWNWSIADKASNPLGSASGLAVNDTSLMLTQVFANSIRTVLTANLVLVTTQVIAVDADTTDMIVTITLGASSTGFVLTVNSTPLTPALSCPFNPTIMLISETEVASTGVPTLSSWGSVLLVALVLGGGAAIVRYFRGT
ncbi:MAG TPA: hypothetical protein VJS92_05080 [Candidatus Polarisedimenticolaceae bacterium]|nr:hypothetical protein [Candidatus Polarisedimenticolaceae bacterium]